MKLNDLEPLQIFELDGQKYECIEVYPGGRIAACYELDENGNYIPTGDSDRPYKIRLISDIRFNRNFETDEEKELNDLL